MSGESENHYSMVIAAIAILRDLLYFSPKSFKDFKDLTSCSFFQASDPECRSDPDETWVNYVGYYSTVTRQMKRMKEIGQALTDL